MPSQVDLNMDLTILLRTRADLETASKVLILPDSKVKMELSSLLPAPAVEVRSSRKETKSCKTKARLVRQRP